MGWRAVLIGVLAVLAAGVLLGHLLVPGGLPAQAWWAALLFVCGVGLVLAECVLPGGVCGALGVVLLLASCGLAWTAFPAYGWMLVLAEVLSTGLMLLAGIHVLPETRFGKILVQGESQLAAAGYVAAESNEALAGQTGEVYTALRPAGTIMVNGERIDAVSDGAFIDKGAAIRVVEVHGSRVVVERIEVEPNVEQEETS